MEIKNLTAENFDQVISGEGLVLVDFWATWCGPCRQMGPVLEELATEHPDVTVGKVNVDEQPELASRYGVRSIPYFGLFQKGELVAQTLGAQPKSSMEKLIDRK